MEQNEFALVNPTLENEVKLTCSLEETETGKRIRMEFRNKGLGLNLPLIQSTDRHLNYIVESKDEADRLISYLIGLTNKL